MAQLVDDDPRIIEFDVRTDEMLINMGPQHPSTHGVLRLVPRPDGRRWSLILATCPAVQRRSPKTCRPGSGFPTPTGWIIWLQ